MDHATLAVIAAAIAPLSCIAAQDPIAVAAGDRIRITAPGVFSAMGPVVLIALNTDTLVVQRDQNMWRVPLASVTRIEVTRGQQSFGPVRGAMWGFLVGTSLGALGGHALGDDPPSESCDTEVWLACWGSRSLSDRRNTALENALIGALTGGIVGVLVGRSLGANKKLDRWEEVPLDQLRVSLAPQRGGHLGIGLSVVY